MRYKLFEGDASHVDDLAAWVDAAVGGFSLPSGLGLRVLGLGFRVGFRVQGLGFKVYRVWG